MILQGLINSAVVVLWVLSTKAEATVVHWTVTPARVEYNENTDVRIKIKVSEIYELIRDGVSLNYFPYSYTRTSKRYYDSSSGTYKYRYTYHYSPPERHSSSLTVMSFENDKCTPGTNGSIHVCDITNTRFDVKITDLENLHSFVLTVGTLTSYYDVGFKRPTGLRITNVFDDTITNVTLSPGDGFPMFCLFSGGYLHREAKFTWLTNSTNSADTQSQITVNKTGWTNFVAAPPSAPNELSTSRIWQEAPFVQPGDDGYYWCEAVYNPARIGRFRSQKVYLNVRYAPEKNPRITESRFVAAKLGNEVVLRWNVIANPVPHQVTWTRHLLNGQAQSPDNKLYQRRSGVNMKGYEYSLVFMATEESLGMYELVIRNHEGMTSTAFTVTKWVKLPETSTSTPIATTTETPGGTSDHQSTQCPPCRTATHCPIPTPAQCPAPTAAQCPAPTAAQCPAPTAAQCPAPTAARCPAPTATQCPAPTAAQCPAPTAAQCPAPTAAQCPAPTAAQCPAPTAAQCPAPTPAQCPAPTAAQCPAPRAAQCPAPTAAQCPAPTAAQCPAPRAAQCPAPTPAQCPAPTAAQCPAPTAAQCPAPTAAQCPAPREAQCPAPKPAQCPAPTAAQCPAPTPAQCPPPTPGQCDPTPKSNDPTTPTSGTQTKEPTSSAPNSIPTAYPRQFAQYAPPAVDHSARSWIGVALTLGVINFILTILIICGFVMWFRSRNEPKSGSESRKDKERPVDTDMAVSNPIYSTTSEEGTEA